LLVEDVLDVAAEQFSGRRGGGDGAAGAMGRVAVKQFAQVPEAVRARMR